MKPGTAQDADRLHAEHRQDDRRLRREVYARLLLELEALDLLVSHYTRPVTREDFDAWLRAYRIANVHVRLIESGSVKAARHAVSEVIDRLGDDVMRRAEMEEPMEDALGIPYVAMRREIHEVARALGNAMSTDLELVRS